ncbi:MAG: hypothetical protein ABW061_22065 [Polyangiaceae bacterium]
MPPSKPPTATPSAVPGLVTRFTSSYSFLGVDVKRNVTTEGRVPGTGSYRISQTALSVQVSSGFFKGSGTEVGNVSASAGTDADLQFSARKNTLSMTSGGYHLSVVTDVASGRVNLGEHNDDGSIGGNIGAGGDLAGTEATLDTPGGNSFSYGASQSAGASGSIGVRDANHDGRPEFCAKFSLPAFTLGACIQQFW